MTSTTSSQPYGGHALRFNMDQCNKLGAGSFATVYKGHMPRAMMLPSLALIVRITIVI